MRHFYSRWPRFLQVSRVVLVASMVLAIFQVPAHAQGKERPVKHPTLYRTIQVDGYGGGRYCGADRSVHEGAEMSTRIREGFESST